MRFVRRNLDNSQFCQVMKPTILWAHHFYIQTPIEALSKVKKLTLEKTFSKFILYI
jgi:hypothetical protein